MKKEIKLYNVIFPIWLLMFLPTIWIFVIPANFIVDFCVIYFTAKYLKLENPKDFTKKHILKAWIFGFLSDFVGTLFLFSLLISDTLNSNPIISDIINKATDNPFGNIFAFLLVLFAVALSGLAIYLLNYFVTFRKTDIDKSLKIKLSLSLAIFTAPYLFLLPTSLFY